MPEYDPFGINGGTTATATKGTQPVNATGGTGKSNAGRLYDPFNIGSIQAAPNPTPTPQQQPQAPAAKPTSLFGHITNAAKDVATMAGHAGRAVARPAVDVATGQGGKLVHDVATLGSSDIGKGGFNATTKMVNQGVQSGKQVVDTGKMLLANRHIPGTNVTVPNMPNVRVPGTNITVGGSKNSTAFAKAQKQSQKDYQGFKNTGGLFNAGTINTQKEAQQGTAKGAAKIAANTAGAATEVVPFAKGAEAAKLAEEAVKTGKLAKTGEVGINAAKAGTINAGFGGVSSAANQYANTGKVNVKQIAKDTALSAGQGVGLDLAGHAIGTGIGTVADKLSTTGAKDALQTAKQNTLLNMVKDKGAPTTTNAKVNDLIKTHQAITDQATKSQQAQLPENHANYFNMKADTKVVPIDKLVSSKTAEDNVKGGTNAAEFMKQAAAGETGKRAPITVAEQLGGGYKVLDGNGTLTAAQDHGWKSLPVNVVDEGHYNAAKELNTKAQAVNDNFHNSVQKVTSAYGLNYSPGPVKGTDRILEKAVNDYGGDVSKVRDSVRGTIPIPNPKDAQQYIDALGKQFDVTRVKNGYEDTGSGYKDIKVNVQTKDGHQGEIILATPEMLSAKNDQGGHTLYEKARDPNTAPGERQQLQQQMDKLYGDAHTAASKRSASSGDLPYSDSKTLAAAAGETSREPSRTTPTRSDLPVNTTVSDKTPLTSGRTASTTSSGVTKNLAGDSNRSILSSIAGKGEKVNKESANASAIAKDIQTKAVAKGLTKGYGELAQYSRINVKQEAAKAVDLVNGDKATLEKIIRGEKPLPSDVRATSVIKAVENHPTYGQDPNMLKALAKSPLNTEASRSAQELRLAAERDKFSPVGAIKSVQDAKTAAFETKSKTPATKAVSSEVQQIRAAKAAAPKVSKETFASFVDSLKC